MENILLHVIVVCIRFIHFNKTILSLLDVITLYFMLQEHENKRRPYFFSIFYFNFRDKANAK